MHRPRAILQGPKRRRPRARNAVLAWAPARAESVGDLVPILPAEITLSPDPEPAPVAKKQTTGSVGDMIPLLQPDPDPAALSPAVSTSWMEPPPVRRPPAAGTSAPSSPAPAKPSKPSDSAPRRAVPAPRSRTVSPDAFTPLPVLKPEPVPEPATNGPRETIPVDWQQTPPPQKAGTDGVDTPKEPMPMIGP